MVFIHYEIDPQQLQPEIPFELDLYKGHAYVSLVAFRQNHFRFSKGERHRSEERRHRSVTPRIYPTDW